jgi:hypothetical protein
MADLNQKYWARLRRTYRTRRRPSGMTLTLRCLERARRPISCTSGWKGTYTRRPGPSCKAMRQPRDDRTFERSATHRLRNSVDRARPGHERRSSGAHSIVGRRASCHAPEVGFSGPKRGRLAPKTYARYTEVIALFTQSLNGYAANSLSRSERALFDRHFNAEGSSIASSAISSVPSIFSRMSVSF